jgi:flagellar assembly protein FliH
MSDEKRTPQDWEKWSLPEMGLGKSKAVQKYSSKKPATLKETQNIRQAAHQDGFKQGHAEGLERGMREGLEEGRAEVRGQISKLNFLLQALHEHLLEQDSNIIGTLSEVVQMLCLAILGHQIEQNPAVIKEQLHELLHALPANGEQVKIHLNPKDKAWLKTQLSELEGWSDDFQMLDNPQISAGGCIVESKDQWIDVTLEKRLKHLCQGFFATSEEQGDTDE